ncbi:ogr/Delta-like zinc finger family protein [Thauera butanivorans]|uniref:ogr/Delta-like zinc finger family protein n=1 Tax=Thauera butanivorans TaxID=86174 RepID=UPI003AB318FA
MCERWYGIDLDAPRFLSLEDYQGHLNNIANGDRGRMIFRCPHCGSVSRMRTSETLSPLLKEAYYRCDNLVCGHSFKVMVEAVQTISPSSRPIPEIAAILERKPASEPPPSQETRERMARLERQAREMERQERVKKIQYRMNSRDAP